MNGRTSKPAPTAKRKFSRRRFLLASVLGIPGALVGHARFIEPDWLKVRTIRLSSEARKLRFVHFTDLHYKGDRETAEAVVHRINSLSPDFVCFTGDLIEEPGDLDAAVKILAGIKSPLFAVPGNHDFWTKLPMSRFVNAFTQIGADWLLDESRSLADGKVHLVGASCRSDHDPLPAPKVGAFNLLLMHYPAWVNNLRGSNFDLILAGHSHGGQVRIPFYGAIMLPFAVDQYDLGMFQTSAGRLYVNPGIGWFPVPLRFNCRPEITVFEL